jgi:hypothetical protein
MNKAALRREMQRMLRDFPAGTVLTGRDRWLAGGVLAMHPHRAEKVGPGVDELVIRNGYGNNREFHVIRTDGTEIDFSYREALAPQTAAKQRADLLTTLRWEIASQTSAFRRTQLERDPICAISAIPLTAETAHVDHIPPWTFVAIATAWLEHRPPLELESIGRGSQLADREQAADWQRFHRWAARLRLIHRDINAAIATCRSAAEKPAGP